MLEWRFSREDWKDLMIGLKERLRKIRVLKLINPVLLSLFTRSGHSKWFLSFCKFIWVIILLSRVFSGTSSPASATSSTPSGSLSFTLCSVAPLKWTMNLRNTKSPWNNTRCKNNDSRNTGKHKRELIMTSKMEMLHSLLKKFIRMMISSKRKKFLKKRKRL